MHFCYSLEKRKTGKVMVKEDYLANLSNVFSLDRLEWLTGLD